MLIMADIYIAVVSSAHNVCPKGFYIAIVSTIAETTANHHLELEPGFERLGRIEEKFMVNPFPRKQKTRSADNTRVHQSHCTSHWKAESTTTFLSLRAMTLPAISRRPLMMLRISIVGPRAMNLLLKG
jgi:RAB protein geranylgeranyltransferase component A